MKKFFKTLFFRAYLFFAALCHGLRAAENEALVATGGGGETEINGEKHIRANSVAGAMLRGEVTQAVKELRYRTYMIDREAKKFEYLSPTLALRREKQDSKFVEYENKENLELVVIQLNDVYRESVNETLENNGERLNKPKSAIKVIRPDWFAPRYKIEDYTHRVVVRRVKDDDCIVDFYVDMYPDNTRFKSKGFVREVENLYNNGRRTDLLDIDELHFTTYKAYNAEDLVQFEYKIGQFIEVVPYNGVYIIRFHAKAVVDGKDLVMTEYYDKTMAEKYEKKEKKDVVYDLFGNTPTRTYKCSQCGKEITYDADKLGQMALSKPRLITDEDAKVDTGATEYFDAEIAQYSLGRCLCKECLSKYLRNLPQ